MEYGIEEKSMNCNSYCIILNTGEKVWRIVCDECHDCDPDNYEVEYFTDSVGNKIPAPDMTDAIPCGECTKKGSVGLINNWETIKN